MSFCRITGKCRSLPKPNYFPMLPPISPAAAKRFCRVTGKAYGLPSHHFIPVLLVRGQAPGRERCKITNVAGELDPHHYQPGTYGCRKHAVLGTFRYVLPVLDAGDESQRTLTGVLEAKAGRPVEQTLYVYRVDERGFGLVFPARLEAAVRDGDVRDVMLAKESDKLLIKLRQGNSVSVALRGVDQDVLEQLYEGEGPREEVIKKRAKEDAKRPKPNRGNRGQLAGIANIFEQKEKVQDDAEEQEQRFIEEHREKAVRLAAERRERQRAEKLRALQLDAHLIEQQPELADLVKPLIESWDWSTLEREAATGGGVPNRLKELPQLITVTPVEVPARQLDVDPGLLEKCGGLEAASYVGVITPVRVELRPERAKAIGALAPDTLQALCGVDERLADGGAQELLAHLDDLASVVTHLSQGQPAEVNGVPGVRLVVNHQPVFVPGQMLLVTGKPCFVPGQTLGQEFVPGVTITAPDGTIQFIPGELMAGTGRSAQASFIAGKQIDGRFVPGQVLGDEPRFVEGATIVTPEGVSKFVAGVVDDRSGLFVPGQPIHTPDGGLQFMPGQTITVQGRERFIPGQNVATASGELMFIPGQTVGDRFVPGRTITTAEGAKFVPGQYVGDVFVPGVGDGTRFVPGVNVDTKEGSKFIEGQIVHSRHGDVFMPGTTTIDGGEVRFELAATIEAIRFSEASPVGLVVDGERLTVGEPSICVFGHLVQNEASGEVEFYPERIGREHLPAGKVVPGKLVRHRLDSKFIPGIRTTDGGDDSGFIPGQVVLTDRGEQFVPGQVIETSEGMKFVPGQIIETRAGPKFVPGQTMDGGPDGPRFVPGQIINTRAGPTFIPGQVISTDDDGERFVPGQIVDTDEGPRFVPGRVLETADKVTFIPGRIVQTADGPRFVAPDLKDTADGDEEFLVQSFTVTPEELKLLKPTDGGALTGDGPRSLVVSLDSAILQSLAESGMPIGRQVEASAVDYVLESTKERQALQRLLAEGGMPGASLDTLETIFDGLKAVCRKVDPGALQYGETIATDERVCNGSIGVVEALAANLAAVLGGSDGQGRSIHELIAEAILTGGEYTVDELRHVVESPEAVEYLFGAVNRTIVKNNIDQKLRTLAALMEEPEPDEQAQAQVPPPLTDAIEEFCQLLDNGAMAEAFVNLLKKDEHLFKSIVTSLKSSGVVEGSVNISEILQTALVDSIQERAQVALAELVEDAGQSHDGRTLRVLLQKCEGLSHALGHSKEAETFRYLMTRPGALRDLQRDDELFAIVNRVLIMEQLAEDDDEYRELMEGLGRTPTQATKSDRFRELIRQSGALSYAPRRIAALETSKDVPLSLFYANNQLAIEEFFLRSGQGRSRGHCSKAFLIIKRGFQAVIPRESSHEVLAGTIAYTVLDEDGIRHFQPLNVLSALRITPQFLARFSMYSCEVREDDLADPDTISSTHSSSSTSHDALDGLPDETAYFHYRPSAASRRSSLRTPVPQYSGRPKLQRHDSLSPQVRRKSVLQNGYHAPLHHHVVPRTSLVLPNSLPIHRYQPKAYPHAPADNVKTLPMAMRIAIKASIAGREPSACLRSSSRDSIYRTSSRGSVHDWK
ncbi:uncharacterized protein LOC131212850 [Anopheles bellator]|uniref:uncharacterized protein LOC131212850 n=1 Tax=Anopheles bellator TaxID=139047 RepID=UPI002647E2C5|nr:uncharacterized protein LOC131212850 [Anopheles bellator]